MRAKVARSRRGFTLVELAIVLAVSGLLFAGLWRLIANSNQQAQDTHAANGQTQLIQAVTGYLASSEGQTFMATNNATANPYNLPLPTSNNSTADCQAHIAATNKGFCNFLPAGFTNTTPNSYSQTYAIQVMGNGAGANVAPTTYSFMIVTLNGTQIPDSSGGRIASLIGGDGGFLYGTAICTAGIDPSTACGAYGAWSAKITGASPGYNFPAGDAVAGHIASRTYVSPTNSSQLVWLARPLLPGDNAAQPLYNTMQTNMFLGDNAGTGNPNIFYLGKSTTDTHGGEITGTYQNGDLTGVQLTSTGALPPPVLVRLVGESNVANANPALVVSNGQNCNMVQSDIGNPNPSCQYAAEILGDLDVSNFINVNANIYLSQNLYTSSDFRLKKEIEPLHDSLQSLMKIQPVSFVFKSNNQKELGVIAQNVAKVYPQLVDTASRTEYVNYNGLIAPLIGAVQELKQENDSLRQQVEDQAHREDNLEHEIRALKSADKKSN